MRNFKKTKIRTRIFKDAHLFLLIILAVTVFSVPSEAAKENDSSPSDSLFLGNETLPPMIYMKDGKPVGIIVDLAEAIKSRMSLPVRLKYMNWSQAQQLVIEGKADALLQINSSEERKKIYDFSDSLLKSEFSIFISSDRKNVYDISSLRGLRVGVEEKGLPIQILKNEPLIKVVVVPDITGGFHMLADGAVDAVVIDRWVGSFVLAENNIGKIRIAGEPIEKSSSAIAVRKGNKKLLADINKALAEIKNDGTYTKILAKWEPKEIVFRTKEQVNRQQMVFFAVLCVLSIMIIFGGFLLVEIKKRRQSERLLFQIEKKLQATLDATPFPVAVVDLEADKIIYWSQSATDLFGHTAPTASEWYQIAYPDPAYRRDVIEQWKSYLEIARKSGKPVNTGEYRITCKNGSERNCELYATFITENLIVTFNDITERKQMENALKERTDFLDKIIESAALSTLISDEKGTAIRANPACLEFFGATAEEIIGKYNLFQDVVIKRNGFMPVIQGVFEKGGPANIVIDYDFRAVDHINVKNATHKVINSIFTPIKDSNGKVSNVIVQTIDLTNIKRMERELNQALKMESIGKLAGGIAHDFNNILSSIIGFTELALDDVVKGTFLEDNLQEVYTAGKRARDLVKQILAFARQSDEERKPIRVDTITKEVMKLIRSTIPTTIEIKENIESNSLIMGNPTQVHQLFMNLCTNAAQAMGDPGGILEVGLRDVELNEQSSLPRLKLKYGSYVKITISDTGCGIAPDIINSIFEPYFTTKGVGEGTGIGLALVHGIVDAYGGEITVDSKIGQGTTFSIYLPTTKNRESYRLYEKETLPSGTERILLVDDELPIAKIGRRILERLGYRVTVRTSSVEALELFRSKPDDLDLVITDMTMPNMTGEELAMELIAFRPDIPIILCTGYSKNISDEKAAKLGIKALAYKPIVKAVLAKTVRKVLDAGSAGKSGA